MRDTFPFIIRIHYIFKTKVCQPDKLSLFFSLKLFP